MFRFAGFELDPQRFELRGPDDEATKLRPQNFAMLTLFAANAGRVLSKQQLMQAVWPDVHVSDDSLFKCIRELRTALGDDRRQLIKLVSGHGYMFDAEVTREPANGAVPAEAERAEPAAPATAEAALATARWSRFVRRGPIAKHPITGLTRARHTWRWHIHPRAPTTERIVLRPLDRPVASCQADSPPARPP